MKVSHLHRNLYPNKCHYSMSFIKTSCISWMCLWIYCQPALIERHQTICVYNSEEPDMDVFNQVCTTSLFKDQIWVMEEIHLSTANDTPIYVSSKVLVCYLLIECYLKSCLVFDVDGLIVEMKTRCEVLNHADKCFNYHLLAVFCSELGRDALSKEAIKAT